MNIHKLLCHLNYHNWKYWVDRKLTEFGIIQRMRKCTVCNKKERMAGISGHEVWLRPYPKPKSRHEVTK